MTTKFNKMNRFLSVSAFIVSFIALLSTVFRIDISISNDTFIGLGIAIIGILATFMVAYQIFTNLDQKDRLKEIEQSFKKVDRLQNIILGGLGHEQYIRRIDSAKIELKKNPLQALHYTLEALTTILDLEDNYSRISLTMDLIKKIEPSVIKQLQRWEDCDIRNIEACIWNINQYRNQSFYELTDNRSILDNLERELKYVCDLNK